jgi:hypothetical protein
MEEENKQELGDQQVKVIEQLVECSICKTRKTFAKGAAANYHSVYCSKCQTRTPFTIVATQKSN